ncbi:hypothetical protein NP233_g4920 [Leucocoprinus birnbaumii]|uniref:Uncharacterized protein n=1 Tax=Leucocoprinus birnbaumii TaxID=56174 RepID=A0AAD5YX64_9AGAR|nr:hypothetical protein NP233_g4920 [Leucocoprinus birnbaumii]
MPAPVNMNANPRKSKSLYTPILYDVPESTVSSMGEAGTCSTYLKRLTREHLARASMEEMESSASWSPTPESKARIAQLTQKVKRAYADANGNPADGRWAFVSDLLRLRCTRGGRRWIGVNLEARAPEIPKHLCVIPNSSEEWNELERRIKNEEDVNSKVQRWIKTAEFEPLTPDVTVDQDQDQDQEETALHPPVASKPQAKTPGGRTSTSAVQSNLKTGFSISNPLSSGSKFGFNVVKRQDSVIRDTKSKNTPSSAPLRRGSPPSTPLVPDSPSSCAVNGAEVPEQSCHPPTLPLSSNSHSQIVSAVPSSPFGFVNQSQQEFNPPSFRQSQIHTSTPLPVLVDQVQQSGPRRKSSSEASITSVSPVTHAEGDCATQNRKRQRSESPDEPAAKRARAIPDNINHPPTPPPPAKVTAGNLATPSAIKDLPRLTELLALSPRNRWSAPRKRVSKSPTPRTAPIQASESLNHSTISAPPEQPHGQKVVDVVNANDNPPPAATIPEPPSETAPSQAPLTLFSVNTVCEVHDDANGGRSRVAEPAADLESEADDIDTSVIEGVLTVQESLPQTPDFPPSPKGDPFRFPSVSAESLASKLEATTYNLFGLDDLDSSPAKSLSSLAGSDSESDDYNGRDDTTLGNINTAVPKHLHDIVDSEFNPQFTSTQKPGLDFNLASNAVLSGQTISDYVDLANEKLPSTSQLQAEVNSQVDEIDRFMDADLGYDSVVPGS